MKRNSLIFLLIVFLIISGASSFAEPTIVNPDEETRVLIDSVSAYIQTHKPSFQDDFEAKKKWKQGLDYRKGKKSGIRGYANGAYFIETEIPFYLNDQGDTMVCTASGTLRSEDVVFGDLALEVDGRFTAGSSGDWQVFLRDNDEIGISVGININRGLFINRFGKNGTDELFKTKQLPFMKAKFNTDHLLIIAVKSRLIVLINGNFAGMAIDNQFEQHTPGKFGFKLGNKGKERMRAEFDNLKVWRLNGISN